jgi:DNA helicase-2/ATP-dependent DNA helicase PcrA
MIRMEQNYRSTPVILQAANQLIKNNQMRRPKALWTEQKGGAKIELFNAEDEIEEARYAVRNVLKYKAQGRNFADQVIFYRVHAQSRVIEDELMRANVPYKIVGGTRFYDRKEIKDIIAYLRLVAYPHDEVSLKRVINVPTRGVGKKALETLENEARGRTWDEVLQNLATIQGLTPKVQKSLGAFYAWLTKFRLKQGEMKIQEILEKILQDTGYVAALEAERTSEAQARLENIEEFFSVIEDHEERFLTIPSDQKSDQSRLETFLETIELVTDLDAWDQGTNVLTLMTLHTAKGLEFPIVYMVGLEEGIFPHVNSYMGPSDDLEEERRLCYVGITRAREKLHLSYATQRRMYGATHHNLPSRFLNEIPADLFDAGTSYSRAVADDADDDLSIHDPVIEFDDDSPLSPGRFSR